MPVPRVMPVRFREWAVVGCQAAEFRASVVAARAYCVKRAVLWDSCCGRGVLAGAGARGLNWRFRVSERKIAWQRGERMACLMCVYVVQQSKAIRAKAESSSM